MLKPETIAEISARWNSLSHTEQAAIQALPDVKTATEVIEKNIQNDPEAGRAAFGGIGDVLGGAVIGEIVGAILGSLGAGPIGTGAGTLAGGFVGGKLGEMLGEMTWDKMTDPVSEWDGAFSMRYSDVVPGRVPRGLNPNENTSYLGAKTFAPKKDPLTLDLDNDGLETVGINPNAPILFDHDGDGVKTGTGWVKADDGFLAYDRNGNGSIDSGKELFGDATTLYTGGNAADGFAALAQEDTNHDGLVNAADTHFANLRIWRDLNQDAPQEILLGDGISQSGELFTLASQNIAALRVAKTVHSQILANGNQIADLGGYIKTDAPQEIPLYVES